MSEIKDYVVMNITRETARLTRTGFGTSTLFGPHYHMPDRVLTYTDPADMLTDGFLTTDSLYIAALKLMGQTFSPEQFKVGRKLEDTNSKATLAFTGTPSAGTWTLDVGIGDATPVTTGAITYTADDDSSLIETAIEALSGITEVTVTGAYSTGYTIEFTGADANKDFRITGIDISSLTGVTAATATMTQYGSAVETWAVGLNALIAEDNDWYFLLPMINDKIYEDDVEALATITETKLKLMFACSDDPDIYDSNSTDDIAYNLNNSAYDRSSVLFSEDEDNYPVAGLVGGQSPKDPGSLTWKFKQIAGIAPDVLTTSQKNAILAKKANTFEKVGGINMISSEGTVASGEYIDIMRGTDWLQTRMQEDIFSILANSDKIPFTSQGIGIIEGRVRYWLNKAESADVGLLVPGESTITVPAIDNIDPAEKAQRYLSGITFTAKYAGAIHKVGITGKISV